MTLEHMRRLAIEGSKDLAVRQAAVTALDRAYAPDHDPGAAVSAIYEYVRALRFIADPVRTQAIQSPRATLFLRAGNCAQRATLLAAMLLSIGIPAHLTFRVIAANPRFTHQFSHVYLVMAPVSGQRLALDPTYSTNPLGYEYPFRSRVGDFDL
jgi:transglutaminase-like putative cysteine protease